MMGEASTQRGLKRKFKFPEDDILLRKHPRLPRNRENFEILTTTSMYNVGMWIQYARFEESNNDLIQARIVWERVLSLYRCHPILWLKYAEFEIRHNFFDQARDVYERALDLLPIFSELWQAYVTLEEKYKADLEGARRVYDKWLNSCDKPVTFYDWLSYAEFEIRHNDDIEKARLVFYNKVYKRDPLGRMHQCFDRAMANLGLLKSQELPCEVLNMEFFKEQKQCYEQDLQKNPLDYESWVGYTKLVEGLGNKDQTRKLYRQAVANAPPSLDKLVWKNYINLWINYALFEETMAQDFDQTREVYRECLAMIPHDKFSFTKCWLLAAEFEIRQLKLNDARSILEDAISKAPKDKIFQKCIELELGLDEVDRCRELYAKYLEWAPENCEAWIKFARMESLFGEMERARAIFDLAIAQPAMNMPEKLWQAYIGFEEHENNIEKARELYKIVLEKEKQHVGVYVRFARFEARGAELEPIRLNLARGVLLAGLKYFRATAQRDEENQLLRELSRIDCRLRNFGQLIAEASDLPLSVDEECVID